MRSLAAVIGALLRATPALACPLCESENGERVRAGIFDADFGYNLLAMALPFSVLLGIVALIHFGWSWPKGAPDNGAVTEREDR